MKRGGVFLLTATVLLVGGCGADQPTSESLRLAPSDLLGAAASGDSGFRRALPGGELEFPADHGAHADYRAEWWYFTGHLQDADERQFGFQLTFFRYALQPGEPRGTSKWRTNQVAMAHFALTDEQGGRYFFDERLGRTGAELAGAQAKPFRVWQDNWSAASTGETFLPMVLKASTTDVTMELELAGGKPRVLQGDAGLSRKGREPGNASWYYSYTRMPVSGQLVLDGDQVAVTGNAWLDREWSTSSLDAGIDGWDWFALQLDDGRDLMFYRLRDKAGNASPFSTGVIVDSDGHSTALGHDEVKLTALREWRSPRSDAKYPIEWQLSVPAHGLELQFTPLIDAQEQGVSVHYWEGAGRIKGTSHGTPITGRGYAELTGYTAR